MDRVGVGKVLQFIGTRACGKTEGLLDYFYYHQNFHRGIIVSPGEDFSQEYAFHVPLVTVRVSLNQAAESLPHLIEWQRDHLDSHAFVVLDDCWECNTDFRHSLDWLVTHARHVRMTVALIMQHSQWMTPMQRANIDYTFLGRRAHVSAVRSVYEQWGSGIFATFEMFEQVLDQCTRDFGFLVIDHSANGEQLEDKVFWYRADLEAPGRRNFQMSATNVNVNESVQLM